MKTRFTTAIILLMSLLGIWSCKQTEYSKPTGKDDLTGIWMYSDGKNHFEGFSFAGNGSGFFFYYDYEEIDYLQTFPIAYNYNAEESTFYYWEPSDPTGLSDVYNIMVTEASLIMILEGSDPIVMTKVDKIPEVPTDN